MRVRKTIRAKILELRKGKEELLKREYENFQRIGKPKEGKEYPMILRRDVYRADTKLTPYWLKIPIFGVKGGINVPIKTHEPITEDMVCKEAKIIRREGGWFVYITVEKEVEEQNPKSVLAVDLGIRWIATTVNSNNPKPKFYGEELRRIKGHYFYLRRSLALKPTEP
jgi:transposase